MCHLFFPFLRSWLHFYEIVLVFFLQRYLNNLLLVILANVDEAPVQRVYDGMTPWAALRPEGGTGSFRGGTNEWQRIRQSS